MHSVLGAGPHGCSMPGHRARTSTAWTSTQKTRTLRRKPVNAHHPAAGPQGPPGQGREDQDRGAQGEPAAAWCVHARVQSRTINSLFSDLDHDISFIKCDAEGHELRCVKGATGIIKKSKPSWLIEISGDPDDPESAASETFRLLNRESYEAFWFDGESLRKRNTGDRSVNYFFLSAMHLQALREESYESRRVSIKC